MNLKALDCRVSRGVSCAHAHTRAGGHFDLLYGVYHEQSRPSDASGTRLRMFQAGFTLHRCVIYR